MSHISRKSDSIDGIWYDTYEIDEINIPISFLTCTRYEPMCRVGSLIIHFAFTFHIHGNIHLLNTLGLKRKRHE